MDKKTYNKTSEKLQEVEDALKSDSLTNDQRKDFEKKRSALMDLELRPWIPASSIRRMLFFFVLFFGLFTGMIWLWVFLLVLSPRIKGLAGDFPENIKKHIFDKIVNKKSK